MAIISNFHLFVIVEVKHHTHYVEIKRLLFCLIIGVIALEVMRRAEEDLAKFG